MKNWLPKEAIFIGCGILALWTAWAFSLWLKVPGLPKSVEHGGLWGDSFGAFNALISALGFIAIVLTLRSQSAALRIQQEALKQQQDDLHRQRFESSFFELLRLLRECRSQVSYHSELGRKTQLGVLAFSEIVEEFAYIRQGAVFCAQSCDATSL